MEERSLCTSLAVFGPDNDAARLQLRTACELYQRGLNVFPLPYATTQADLVPNLYYTRAHSDYLPQLFAGRCNIGVMCGATSRNLFVIRCLTGQAFSRVLTQLGRKKSLSWAIVRGEGGDILMFCREGPVKSIDSSKLQGLEILGEGAYTVVPPAANEDGVVFKWQRYERDEPRTIHAAALGWLVDEAEQRVPLRIQKKRKLTDPAPVHELAKQVAKALGKSDDERIYLLSGKALRYLAGDENGINDPENKQLFAAACDLSGCGFMLEEASELLLPIALKRHATRDTATATLKAAFQRFRRPARPHENTFTRQPMIFEYVRAFVFAHDWKGRTSSTDRKLMLALAERTKVDPGEDGYYTASQRWIGEHGHINNRGIIRKALKRLHDQGLIEHRPGATTQFRIPQSVLARGRDAYLRPGESEPLLIYTGRKEDRAVRSTNGSLSLIPYDSDAGERGAAGVEGLLAYNLLLQRGPLTTREVGNRLGMTRNQAYYYLAKLRDRRVAILDNHRWSITETLDEEAFTNRFAGPKGKIGKTKQRREQHQLDREIQLSRLLIKSRMEQEPAYPGHWLTCRHCKRVFVAYKASAVEICPRCGTRNPKDVFDGWADVDDAAR